MKKLSLFFLIFFFYYLYSKKSINNKISDCHAKHSPIVKDFWNESTDVSFIAFGDTQIAIDGGDKKRNYRYHIALNEVEKANWTIFNINENITNIRGIIIAGDITQNGRDGRWDSYNEYGVFNKIYGLCGNKKVKFPIYEGYGNHDFFEWSHLAYRIPREHPVVDSVSIRNQHRIGIRNMAPEKDGHYSWEWDGIRFIQLNLCPSDVDPKHKVHGVRNPRKAFTFLKNDLKKINKKKKIVIISHYGPTPTFEYDSKQLEKFYQFIKNYNIIAYIHGHNHKTSFYYWREIPIFNVGSPFSFHNYTSSYAVFKITDDFIYAQDIAFKKENPKKLIFPSRWYKKINISKK